MSNLARSSEMLDHINQFHLEQEMTFCYIRRADRNGWVRARPHHQQALQAFLTHENGVYRNHPEVRIAVPHTDGGEFIAHFRRSSSDVCLYRDEYGNQVDIAMLRPGQAAFINRVIDSY
jgi:hypothetical protein